VEGSKPPFLSVVREQVAPLLWPFLVLAAFANAAINVLATFGGATLPERWQAVGAWARDEVPFVANLCLLAAALTMVFALPALVRLGAASRDRLAHHLFVVAGLVVLALATVRCVADHAALIIAQHLVLAACLIGVLVSALRRRPLTTAAAAAAPLLGALVLPLLWRTLLETAGEHAGALAFLRGAADIAIPLALAATAVAILGEKRRAGLFIAAAIPMLAFVLAAVWRPTATGVVLRERTHLWLSTLPWTATIILFALAILATARVVFGALRGEPTAAFALAITLVSVAGFMPARNESVLLAFLATVAVMHWLAGRGEKLAELPDLVR
jgi:hypothetical protein